MSTKIHHDPNSSYKTFGAIQDDAVSALKDGRVIITNVRGFTLEWAYQVFPDLPNTAEVINLNLESLEGLEKIRTWFQWAPRGTFLIFDETQLLSPKSWREKDLERFDYPGGPETVHAADRSMGWPGAQARHRHFNQDVILITPNISYIRDDTRMACEIAYKHFNLTVIDIPGCYKEAQHDTQLNHPPADGTIIKYKRIRKQTFALYQSTATDKTQDTEAGKSPFRSPKLVLLLALLADTTGLIWHMGPLRVIDDPAAATPADASDGPTQAPAAPTAVAVPAHPATNSFLPPGPVPDGPAATLVDLSAHPFVGRRISILAHTYRKLRGDTYLFVLDDPTGRRLELTGQQPIGPDYRMAPKGECVVELRYEGQKQTVTCARRQPGTTASIVPTVSVAASADVPTRGQSPLTIVPGSEYASQPRRHR